MAKKNGNLDYLSYEDAKLKMEKFCIYQDRCHYEVEQKIYTLQLQKDISNQIIMDLIQEDFLNEERFVKSFVRGKFHQKKWGKNKIKHELKKRNIHQNLIRTGLEEIDQEEYYQVLKTLYLKKYNTINETNTFKKQTKTVNYLMNRGFEYNLIKEVIKEL